MKRKLILCFLLLNSLNLFAQNIDCQNVKAMTLNFKRGIISLTPLHMNVLTTLAKQMRAAPNCRVVVSGTGQSSKLDQQSSWGRTNAVINYLVERQAIDRERFIFKYGEDGVNTVEFRPAEENEEGPSRVSAPFPHLNRR